MGALTGKTALVTGAASGIGKAVATGLAREGANVTILTRTRAKGEAAAKEIGGAVEVLDCDLSSQKSIREAIARWKVMHSRLHVLVNAAGVFRKERHVTPDGFEETFAVNYLAYFSVTNLLLDTLKASAPARIVNVSSRYGGARVNFDDLQTATGYSYMRATPPTMVARVLFTQELAERLAGTGVVVNAVHPGLVRNTALLEDTRGFFRWMTNTFGGTPEKGADTALWLATAPEAAKVTGKLWSSRREMRTPGQGSDPAARKRLWEESVRLTGIGA